MKQIKIQFFIAVLFIFCQLSLAQMTYTAEINSNGFFGLGAFKSTSKIYQTKNVQRSETKMRFTGSMMKHFSPKDLEISIIRLDKELLWNFNASKKEYYETSFGEIKSKFEKSQEMLKSQGGIPDQKQAEELETTYKWDKPKINVEKLSDKMTINGFDCDHFKATVKTIGTHIESGKKDTMLFVSDFWNSVDAEKIMGEAQQFNKKYIKALGYSIDDNQGLAMITGMYSDQMKTLEKEIEKIKGFTIKNNMKLTMTQNFQPDTKSENESVSLDDIKKNLGGLLGKKMMKKKSKTTTLSQSNNSVLIEISFETKNISSDKFPESLLIVPKGYKLKKRQF
ncbi:hypothetical protein ACFL46_05325 [Candidatus Neomarinimicrobiota bacterium]